MLPPIPALEDYGINPEHGFLPPALPLESLPDPYYAKWESVIDNIQPLILSRRVRSIIDRLPVLSTSFLHTDEEWRRAYVVLTFMLHAYVWGGDVPEEVCENLSVGWRRNLLTLFAAKVDSPAHQCAALGSLRLPGIAPSRHLRSSMLMELQAHLCR